VLARACAARVLRHSGSGRDLRRLAATLALGVASSPSALRGPGWRQSLSALTLCTQALGGAAAPDASVAAGVDAAQRLAFCSACLPLALRLIARAEQQQEQLQNQQQEGELGGNSSDDESVLCAILLGSITRRISLDIF
jgi:hypothetical protein